MDLNDAVDVMVDRNPLLLRDALWAVLALERYDLLDPRIGITGKEGDVEADGLAAAATGGYNAAVARMRQAISSALGIQEGGTRD